jgi:chorismate synthase
MAGNSFGTVFRLVTFGESHGPAVGGVLEGCPAGLHLNQEHIRGMMARRKPGTSALVTARNEQDEVQCYSGLENGITTGGPIAFWVYNKDTRSEDYEKLSNVFRPGHADFTYLTKYGITAASGGGRASARETLARVAAGAIAMQLLATAGIQIAAYVHRVADISCDEKYMEAPVNSLVNCHSNALPCPDADAQKHMQEAIEQAAASGDTLGGSIVCVVNGVPAGLGEPVFDKLTARMAQAQMSIQATRYFSWGRGVEATLRKGSENNDAFVNEQGKVSTLTNHAAGSLGGISNGMPLYFEVGFKPVSSIKTEQQTITRAGEPTSVQVTGRHDPCVLPRAVPIVEAMAALVLADLWLLQRLSRIT